MAHFSEHMHMITKMQEMIAKMQDMCGMPKQSREIHNIEQKLHGTNSALGSEMDTAKKKSELEGEILQSQLEKVDRGAQDGMIRNATAALRLRRDLQSLAHDVEQNRVLLLKVQEGLTQHAHAIDEIRLCQDVLDVKTTNGILIWKIPDIRRRYRDAMEHRTISLYSPPFYTSPQGYRMCVRAYLNGDGIGKGTHLSVFFVLMRSEHDNLLSWPFKQSVHFTLINQKNPAASITEAFVPDLHSPSFKKPENDMNIASGFPKFARQSILQDENFTQGNIIYIKCQVDLSGLSTHSSSF